MVPKGAQLVISAYSVHRSAKWWIRPNEFYPEHFTNENSGRRHLYSYLPFSLGPRNCIGKNCLKDYHYLYHYQYHYHDQYNLLNISFRNKIRLVVYEDHFVALG